MLTPNDIVKDTNPSGFKFVTRAGGVSSDKVAPTGRPWNAVKQSIKNTNPGLQRVWWHGPRRTTPLEAAQDYCDYINGQTAQLATLKSAGHTKVKAQSSKPVHPKRAEAYRLMAEANADEGTNTAGYIYCISDGTKVKLGKSADHPQNRLKGLQTGNPRLLALLGFKQVTDRHVAEAALHSKHIAANVLGEWFDPTDAILKDFNIKGVTFSNND